MDISTVRPKVAELTFQLLQRSIHPELFQCYKSHTIDREHYSAKIQINADGHCVTFRANGATLSEVTSSVHQLLPAEGRVLSHPLRLPMENLYSVADTIDYKYRCESERVPAEMLWMIQQKLRESGKQHELLHFFDSSGRIAIGAMSFIHVDTRLKSLHLQAIHTFPDDLTLVKTESTFTVR